MDIYFVRHAETDKNTKGIVHDRGDEEMLNRNGLIQVQKLATALSGKGIIKLYCSSEKRTVQTAHLLSGEMGIPYEISELLRERDWGELSGKPWSEIEDKLRVMTIEERYEFKQLGGESWREMEERAIKGLAYAITETHNNLAIITHYGVLRALMPRLKHESTETSLKYNFENASITHVVFDNGTFTVRNENLTSHL